MEYNSINEILKDIDKLMDEVSALIDSLEADSDINDWCYMHRLLMRWDKVKYMVSVCSDLRYVEYDIENEKDLFLLKKYQQMHFEYLNSELERFVKVIRTWKIEDYRCREWLKRSENVLLGIEDFFPFQESE